MSEPQATGGQQQTVVFRGRGGAKQMRSAAEASAYQKQWFKNIKERVTQGEPCVLNGVGFLEEILITLDIPYVVLPWFTAIIASRQASHAMLPHLEARGYRNVLPYTALPYASTLEPDQTKVPWGGLPKISMMVGVTDKINMLWAKEQGIPVFPITQTVLPEHAPLDWWNYSRYEWEKLFKTYRLDLLVEEITAFIRFLEVTTGRTFSETKFEQVMNRSNEQQEWAKKAQELIALTTPAPISIVDSMTSVQIPQWHRGTEWGLNAVKNFYEEVKEKVERGEAACKDEKIRLMWIGPGVWHNMSFYQHFQDKYGAVFVWSFYLGIAADIYPHYGPDPVRNLAARFVNLTEPMNTPPWNAAWYVHQCKKNSIKGVVYNQKGRALGGYFIKKALEEAGFPVFDLDVDPVDTRDWNDEEITKRFSEFIETRVRGVR